MRPSGCSMKTLPLSEEPRLSRVAGVVLGPTRRCTDRGPPPHGRCPSARRLRPFSGCGGTSTRYSARESLAHLELARAEMPEGPPSSACAQHGRQRALEGLAGEIRAGSAPSPGWRRRRPRGVTSRARAWPWSRSPRPASTGASCWPRQPWRSLTSPAPRGISADARRSRRRGTRARPSASAPRGGDRKRQGGAADASPPRGPNGASAEALLHEVLSARIEHGPAPVAAADVRRPSGSRRWPGQPRRGRADARDRTPVAQRTRTRSLGPGRPAVPRGARADGSSGARRRRLRELTLWRRPRAVDRTGRRDLDPARARRTQATRSRLEEPHSDRDSASPSWSAKD